MSVTGAIVLYSVIWFVVFFINLQLGQYTQGDAGHVIPGTPQSAPENVQIKRKAIITTIVGTVLWAIVCGVILSGWITIRDLDFFGRMGPETPTETTQPATP